MKTCTIIEDEKQIVISVVENDAEVLSLSRPIQRRLRIRAGLANRETLLRNVRRSANVGLQNGSVPGVLAKYVRDRESEIDKYIAEVRRRLLQIERSLQNIKIARELIREDE